VFLCPAGCGDVCRITQYTDIRLKVIAVGLEIGCFPWLIEERSGSKDVYVRVEGGTWFEQSARLSKGKNGRDLALGLHGIPIPNFTAAKVTLCIMFSLHITHSAY
jgi:hypothetical protein